MPSCWELSKSKFDLTTPELRDNILQFYSGVSASAQTKEDEARSASVLALLNQLRAATPVTADAVAAR